MLQDDRRRLTHKDFFFENTSSAIYLFCLTFGVYWLAWWYYHVCQYIKVSRNGRCDKHDWPVWFSALFGLLNLPYLGFIILQDMEDECKKYGIKMHITAKKASKLFYDACIIKVLAVVMDYFYHGFYYINILATVGIFVVCIWIFFCYINNLDNLCKKLKSMGREEAI